MDIKCPKCGSNQIHADKRGFKVGSAVAGAVVGGLLVGAVAGGAGKNKVVITCLACGHQFKPGEGDVSDNSLYSTERTYSKYPEYNCPYCGRFTSFREADKRCPSCGASATECD